MSEDDAAVVEEQATEAEAEVAEVQDEETQETETPESSTEEEHSKGVQKKIDKLTRLRRETERDRDYWREMALKNQQPPPQKEEPVKIERKTLADFDYDEQAYQDHVRDQIVEEARKAAVEAARNTQKTDTIESRRQAHFDRETEFSQTVEDYMTVTRNEAFPLTNEMLDMISESDDSPAILYYLGKNLNTAQKLATLPALTVAREIGKIEAKLAQDRSLKGESVTKAPPPPPKLSGVSNTVNKDPDKMSMNEWLKWRNKQLKKKA